MLDHAIIPAVVAGLLASLACGLGVLPLAFGTDWLRKQSGLGYGFTGGMMFAASVYNLILPGLQLSSGGQANVNAVVSFSHVYPVLVGIIIGAMFLDVAERRLHAHHLSAEKLEKWGGRTGILVFVAMCVHSIPEGVAVGVGYVADTTSLLPDSSLGPHLALAIAIHNIPEGLAVALPMRLAGASLSRCFFAAVLTSLPQPLAVIPAVWLSSLVGSIMPYMMGFAAGSMIFLILLELIPDALNTEKPLRIAWSFVLGFCLMLLVQVIL